MSAPYIPISNLNNDPFKSNIKYTEKLKKRNIVIKESLLSDYDDNNQNNYKPNWVDEF
jgi:hypothetical protein